MLFYLDNWMSADPERSAHGHDAARQPAPRRFRRRPRPGQSGRAAAGAEPGAQAQQRANMPKGLNENYGRELLELHTLGVDGGYTQKDVTEVARAFTGWTIDNPRQRRRLPLRAALHDDGEKVVLGHRIKAGGGERDGEAGARHPGDASVDGAFIATKLARRFVSDTPPPALVDRLGRHVHARPTAICAR